MSHNHHHEHQHGIGCRHHHPRISGKKLFITIILNLGITIAQIIGGIFSGSMALLSDAAHNFSDVLSLIISYVANRLSTKKYTVNETFGFKRAEIFAAFINAFTLVLIAIYILSQAVFHLYKPEVVIGDIVIWLAGLSIILNGVSVLIIKDDAENSINIKSAYLHLFTDMLTSVAVLVSGLLVKYYQLYWVDSVISIGIAFYLIYHSWDILKETLNILMQFTPHNMDVNEVAKKIMELEEVENIHHIHIWKLDENEIILDAHIDTCNDISITEFEKIHYKISVVLKEFNIYNFTIQPEFTRCSDKRIIQE
ncbi:MAG: cobalt-zinc-cadmium efflux system protein [Planctomycetota bacterium]|jgi:cobalt-zinc-cadmium efflux system protein